MLLKMFRHGVRMSRTDRVQMDGRLTTAVMVIVFCSWIWFYSVPWVQVYIAYNQWRFQELDKKSHRVQGTRSKFPEANLSSTLYSMLKCGYSAKGRMAQMHLMHSKSCRPAIPKGRHSEKSAIPKAVIRGLRGNSSRYCVVLFIA